MAGTLAISQEAHVVYMIDIHGHLCCNYEVYYTQ